METLEKLSVVTLRIIIGWFFIYQGIFAFTTANWSIPFISTATIFPEFYHSIVISEHIPTLTLVFKVLFIVVGFLLLTGILVRIASLIGMAMLLFIYFALLRFPYIDTVYYVVDYRLITCAALFVLFSLRSAHAYSLSRFVPFLGRHHT